MIEAEEVRVTWYDSLTPGAGWQQLDEVQKYLRIENLTHHTVGYLIYQSEHSVIISSSIYNGPDWSSVGEVTVIPKCAIEKIENLVG